MCYITKNKTTGITCLTFKCKLAFPTIFNDIHKRVLLILSIYQIVLYRCSHENKVSLLQLYKQCIFMTGFGNRVSHKIWQLKCIKIWKSGKTKCVLWFYVPKTNFWSHKGYVSCRNDWRSYGNFKTLSNK